MEVFLFLLYNFDESVSTSHFLRSAETKAASQETETLYSHESVGFLEIASVHRRSEDLRASRSRIFEFEVMKKLDFDGRI